MDGSRVICPQCKAEFELSAAIERSIAERLRAGMAAENERAEKELRARQQALALQAVELKKAQDQLADQVEFKVAEEKKRIAQEEQRKAREEHAVQMRDLQQQLDVLAMHLHRRAVGEPRHVAAWACKAGDIGKIVRDASGKHDRD